MSDVAFEPLLTPKEAASALRISEDTLRALVRRGELRFYNMGLGTVRKRRRFARADLEAYQGKTAPKPEFDMEEYARVNGLQMPSMEPVVAPTKEGLIYFVGYGRYVKIGFATNFALRLTALQVSSPQGLTVYLTIPGTLEQEKALHRKFSAFHIRGEWFRRTATLGEWIKDEDREMP